MEKVQFEVSAKTARLIGRENISDVDSAVIELIKNSYDADATCAYIGFYIPFPSIPQQISFELATSVFGEGGHSPLFDFYNRTEKCFSKKANLSSSQEKSLAELIFAQNKIIIMDNGCGMNSSILRSAWMNIGTNEKASNRTSPNGRIKTGAKGIGRFALDKLSCKTTVYTKSKDDSLLRWQIDWDQFETASLLNEVSATLEVVDDEFSRLARRIAGTNIKSFNEYNWSTGTIIELTPTREPWSEWYFSKVNRNLKSIFPPTNNSHFDTYVFNRYFPQYSLFNERFDLQSSEYDYKISATFDGYEKLTVSLSRNEVDTRKIKVKRIIDGVEKELLLNDFWKSTAFESEGYRRADFSKSITHTFNAPQLLNVDSSALEQVGPFSTEMYFIKSAASSVEIIKPVVSTRRKQILSEYSGIKLYRDGFKVRPYGEDGPSFDWLGLGIRAQKSPAAASHPTGSWRVLPYQIVGAVRITHKDNPNLFDMANREGLATNDAYFLFIKIIDKIIETFEGDRQLVYREYSRWLKECDRKLSKASEIVDAVTTARTQGAASQPKKDVASSPHSATDKEAGFSLPEYESTVSSLDAENKRQRRANQTMMLFSSAGVMANTFAHEIGRIATNAGSRMQHIRATVKHLLGKDGYTGHPDLNPLPLIDEAEKIDLLLESWINILMDGTSNEKFEKSTLSLEKSIGQIIALWEPMLAKKYIFVVPNFDNLSQNCMLSIAEIDLHIIFNNFFLNSAWFLEEADVERREIRVTVSDSADKVTIILENNGPPLDPRFLSNPNQIFDAGISTKKNKDGKDAGTGLGLWITKTVVEENNSGEIHPIVMEKGFALKIVLPK